MKKILAGVDEVGRGSLIGPVFAAAVILDERIDKTFTMAVFMILAMSKENTSSFKLFVDD